MRNIQSLLKTTTLSLRIFTSFTGQSKIKNTSHASQITANFPFHGWSHIFLRLGLKSTYVTTSKPTKPLLPRNQEIVAESITVIDEAGKISGPHKTKKFFEDFDFEKKSLVTILEGNPEDGRSPLCRIYDKSGLRDKEISALKKNTTKKGVTTKTIEISWAVDENDLNTKLRRLREFLEKGCHVDVFLKAKKRGREVTIDDGEKIVQRILDTVKQAGGRKNMPPVGEMLGTMEMSFLRKKTT
ncbi:putative translation initiation factor [Erysiphe neolycopersici]|uniref:Putative translation initiation factor n=1 Tax=Erysiphe neolycopersici TaxID=212602 RepID=A0A420HWQ9_9PEZI|nr:putative translation initiation factor [Erysiphe neolycopersici]